MPAPEQIQPQKLADYLEVMTKAVFQSGMTWRVVENKWPGIRQAFHNFEPMAVATISGAELKALAGDTRVIRNRRKLGAIVENAQEMVQLEEKHGTFGRYLRSHGGFDACAADLKKRFRFLGDTGAYYFLYVVGEEVPEYDAWCASRGITPMHG